MSVLRTLELTNEIYPDCSSNQVHIGRNSADPEKELYRCVLFQRVIGLSFTFCYTQRSEGSLIQLKSICHHSFEDLSVGCKYDPFETPGDRDFIHFIFCLSQLNSESREGLSCGLQLSTLYWRLLTRPWGLLGVDGGYV